MQRIEIILSGPDEEQCAELIYSLASEAARHFDVCRGQGYCGPAPVKKGYGELLVPGYMRDKPSAADKKKSTFPWRRKGSHES